MNIMFFDFQSSYKINATIEYYERLRYALRIKKLVDKNFVRLGRPYDGGYIMVDNFNISRGGGGCLFVRHKQ